MLRNVLDRSRRQRHHRFALLPNKSQVRGLLGRSRTGGLILHFYVAHPVHRFLDRLGCALCIACGAICAVLHVATFITMVPLVWVLPPFALMFGVALCAWAFRSELRIKTPAARNRTMIRLRLVGFALLVYAVL